MEDLEITLRHVPSNTVVTLMQDAGGSGGVTSLGPDEFIFDDQAAGPIPETVVGITSGTFQPSIYETPQTTAPAANGVDLAAFNGLDPNGIWELYMFDDFPFSTGSFTDWEVQITTDCSTTALPCADQNGDGLILPDDFSAFLTNLASGNSDADVTATALLTLLTSAPGSRRSAPASPAVPAARPDTRSGI